MKITYFLLLSMFLFASCVKAHRQTWKLIWSDDFNGNGKLDSCKWTFNGRETADWGCHCTDSLQNEEVLGGYLHLRGTNSMNSLDTSKFHTGCINTKEKFSFEYGKIEVRAKLGQAQGSWPAIWMLPASNVNGTWPKGGEIDIMEQLNHESICYQTIHSYYVDKEGHKTDPLHYITAPFNVGAFNVWGIEWYPDRIDFFVNGVKTFTYPKLSNADQYQWPFDQKFYIILDQALGGSWPGPVNPKELPVEMEVDWVKVYQLIKY